MDFEFSEAATSSFFLALSPLGGQEFQPFEWDAEQLSSVFSILCSKSEPPSLMELLSPHPCTAPFQAT